jgi:hypothetical protein
MQSRSQNTAQVDRMKFSARSQAGRCPLWVQTRKSGNAMATSDLPLKADIAGGPESVKRIISAARNARDFAWSYLDSSLAKGYPSFCQSANSITTAVTLVKPISLSCLAASVARPPLAHCTYILRFMSTLFG